MATLNKHVHLLFDPKEYKHLKNIAELQKKPLAELVRLAIQKTYGVQADNKKKEAADFLLNQDDYPVKNPQEMKKDYAAYYEKKRLY